MTEERKLILETYETCDDFVVARVAQQSHKREEFNPRENGFFGSKRFASKSGVTIESQHHPLYSQDDRILYVRGSDHSADNNLIVIPEDHWPDVKKAVQEYNETFTNEDDKRQRSNDCPIQVDEIVGE